MQGLEEIPELFGDYLNISTDAAGTILSMIVLLSVMIPVMIASRGSRSMTVELIVGIGTLCALTAISWLPLWTLIIMVMAIVLLWANMMGKIVTGGD